MSERDDAAAVYRLLREAGAMTVADLASSCFPVPSSGPRSSVLALQRSSVRRVLEAVVWMRSRGVALRVVPVNSVDDDRSMSVVRLETP